MKKFITSLLLTLTTLLIPTTLWAADPNLTDDYTLVKSVTWGDGTNIAGSGSCTHTAYDTGNKRQQALTILTAPEDAAGWIAMQGWTDGSGKGWWNRADKGLYCVNGGRSAAVFGDDLTTGWLVIFECSQTASAVMTLTNGSSEPDGTFSYAASEDGKSYICTITAAENAYVGFCGNKNVGFITKISVYKPKNAIVPTTYTVNYMDTLGTTLKDPVVYDAIVGAAITLSAADKADITVGEDTYIYFSDDSEGKVVEANGASVVNVKFRKAPNFNFTVNEKCGTDVVRETKGISYETATVIAPYRKYNAIGGQLYKKDATDKEFNHRFKLTQDNQVENLSYNMVDGTNQVVFITEGEDVEGMTVSTAGNIPVRASNAQAGVSTEDINITTLPAGKYIFHAGVFTSKSSSYENYFINFGIGANTFKAACSGANLNEVASEEITLTGKTAVKFLGTTSADGAQFDYLWIEKTGDYVITPAYGTIWENGETTTDTNENTIAEVDGAYFNNFAKANDTIRATVVVAAPARAAGPARIIATGNLSVFAGMTPIYEAANIPVGESKLDIALDNEDLAAIAEAGSLKFVYSNLTLKKVELIEGVADSETIAELVKLQQEIEKAEGLLANENKTNGRDEFLTAINAAKALLNSIDIDAIKAGITALQTAEQTFIKANYYIEFPAGQYYIIDTESGKFMAAGHDYGTRGIVNEIGLDLTLTPNTESRMITIDTRVKNGNNHFLGTNLYMDAATTEWALEYQGFGFWITDGTKYISIDDKDNLVMSETPREWIIVTNEGVIEQRINELAEATKDAPKDATWAIQAPNFNRNDQRVEAWQISSDCTNKNLSGGSDDNRCAESWHSTFTISQTLTGMPKGVYALTAQGFYRQDDNATEDAPVFFANAETGAVPVKTGSENSMADASASFTNGSYVIDPIFVEVGDDNTLAIGIKGTATHQWVIWDNFQLKYYGSAASIDEIKNAAILAEMNALRLQLTAIKEEVEIQAVKDSIDTALTSTEGATGTEGINAAIVTLKAALEKAQAYVKAKNVLPKMKQITEETNFYTAEALQSYYTQWNEKYQAGTLTKTEADALQDPFLISDWRASVTVDDLLMSVWGVATEQWDNLHVNTWSIEGETDGSEFKVPFIEYWTGDANSLGEKALTATMSGLPEGNYQVGIRVRVRVKNAAQAPATGITMNVNGETAVDVCAGTQVGETQFYLGEFTAVGDVYEDGVLKLNINVAAENNISWLSFKDVVYTRLGEVVGIAGVKSVNKLDGTVYNLNGQKVEKAQKGLYIINGKKVVVK